MKRFLYGILIAALLVVASGCERRESTGPSPAAQKTTVASWKGKNHFVFSGARANFPRIAVWLFNELYNEFPHRELTGEILFTGSGYATEVRNVGEGIAQFCVTTPAATATMGYKGVGLFSKAYPNLRGLFKIPQRDPITLAVKADSGITSFDQVIQKKIPLRIATGYQDGDDGTGFLFSAFLKAYGASVQDLESWGGKVVGASTSGPAIARIEAGEADAIFHEGAAVASPRWKELNAKIPMRVLSVREDVIQQLGQYGYPKFADVLPKGKYPGVVEDVVTIDYSHWIVLADASVPENVAYLMAKIAAERKGSFESQYPNLLPANTKELGQTATDPKTMWKDLGVPLHPGAEKYYREKGLMP